MTDEPLISYPWGGRMVRYDLPNKDHIPETLETTFGEIRDVLDSMTHFTVKEKTFFLYMLNTAGGKIEDRRRFGIGVKK